MYEIQISNRVLHIELSQGFLSSSKYRILSFLPFDKCFCVVHFARTKCALHFSFADVALLKDAALKLLILMDKTKICAAFENLEK